MYSNLNNIAEKYTSEKNMHQILFAPYSSLKFMVAVGELKRIFCVMQKDFNGSMRRWFNSQPEPSVEVS